MKEKDINKKILEYLNNLPNTFAFRVESRPGMSRGIADILCCRNGKFMAIEVKMPGKKPTPLQDRFLGKVANAGGISFVAHSLSDLEEQWF